MECNLSGVQPILMILCHVQAKTGRDCPELYVNLQCESDKSATLEVLHMAIKN